MRVQKLTHVNPKTNKLPLNSTFTKFLSKYVSMCVTLFCCELVKSVQLESYAKPTKTYESKIYLLISMNRLRTQTFSILPKFNWYDSSAARMPEFTDKTASRRRSSQQQISGSFIR